MSGIQDCERDGTFRVARFSDSDHHRYRFVEHCYEVLDPDGRTVAEGLWGHGVCSREGRGICTWHEASSLDLVWAALDSLGLFESDLVLYFWCLGSQHPAGFKPLGCSVHIEVRRQGAIRMEKGVDL